MKSVGRCFIAYQDFNFQSLTGMEMGTIARGDGRGRGWLLWDEVGTGDCWN